MGSTFAICIGDTHFPFTNMKSLKTIYKSIAELKPTYIVQMGDLLDQFCATRFPRSQSYITPDAEYAKGRKMAEDFWKTLRKASPKSKCYQLIGNHDERAKKRILSLAPELEPLLDVQRLYEFDGVISKREERDGLILGGILFMHGYRTKLGDHARHAHMPVVCGHTHRGGTGFIRYGDKTIWELNCGFVGDTSSRPLSYSKQRHIATTTQGFGILSKIGGIVTPTFVPLPNR